MVNWEGSAKAMEPSMGVEMSKNLSGEIVLGKEGDSTTVSYSLGNIIMDGDTTTIAHVNQEVDEAIGNWTDVGHAKKALLGHLITVGAKHKSLTKQVIEYLGKCFTYVLTQNKGDASEIRRSCKVIPKHAFGDHSCCGKWCGHLKDPNTYRHKTLPHGKDLQGEELRQELIQVIHIINNYSVFLNSSPFNSVHFYISI